MSKAEERAFEKYPVHSVLIVPARGGGYYADNHLREGFIEGYHQAEKDLELTWEDMLRIDEITSQVFKDSDTCQTEVIYQEVLKRFKDYKERKSNEGG